MPRQPSQRCERDAPNSPNPDTNPTPTPIIEPTINPHELSTQLPCLNCAIIIASDELTISPTEMCNSQDEYPCSHCRQNGIFCLIPSNSESQHILAHLLYAHTATGELLRTASGDLVRRVGLERVGFWIEACRLFVVHTYEDSGSS